MKQPATNLARRHRPFGFWPALLCFALTVGIGLAAPAAWASLAIGPSRLEVNLGPIPVDTYSTSVANGTTIPTCAAKTSVRACVQSILKLYAGQGITGVRFQLGLGAGSVPSSTAFSTTGQVQTAWLSRLADFFYDLRAAGMLQITPTTGLGEDWSGTLQAATVPYRTGTGCPTGSKQLLFLPWLPYGFDPTPTATTPTPARRKTRSSGAGCHITNWCSPSPTRPRRPG
jgi:hypothetical protein